MSRCSVPNSQAHCIRSPISHPHTLTCHPDPLTLTRFRLTTTTPLACTAWPCSWLTFPSGFNHRPLRSQHPASQHRTPLRRPHLPTTAPARAAARRPSPDNTPPAVSALLQTVPTAARLMASLSCPKCPGHDVPVHSGPTCFLDSTCFIDLRPSRSTFSSPSAAARR